VGLPFGSNDPREIAISIVAQLLTERDGLQAGKNQKIQNSKGQTNPNS
jgi:xanthine/CO dehydrogenase XdhC/CoxF family maturation factor